MGSANRGTAIANFMGARKKGALSAGKPMSIKFLLLGGGGILGFFGGECRFYFYGREDFSEMGSANRGTAIAPISTIGTRYGNSVSTASMPPKPTSKLSLK